MTLFFSSPYSHRALQAFIGGLLYSLEIDHPDEEIAMSRYEFSQGFGFANRTNRIITRQGSEVVLFSASLCLFLPQRSLMQKQTVPMMMKRVYLCPPLPKALLQASVRLVWSSACSRYMRGAGEPLTAAPTFQTGT